MARKTADLFREYDHELLHAKNVEFLTVVYRRTLMQSAVPWHEEASINETRRRIRDQLQTLNHPVIWRSVFRVLDNKKAADLAYHISYWNNKPVHSIAVLTSTGILVGHALLEVSVRKHRPTPERNAALTAIEVFQARVTNRDEIVPRLTSVLGSLEKPGTLGAALASFPEEMVEAQVVFVDMLRIYGNALEAGEIS